MKKKSELELIRESLVDMTPEERALVAAFIDGMLAERRAAGAGRDHPVSTVTAKKVRKVTKKLGGAK